MTRFVAALCLAVVLATAPGAPTSAASAAGPVAAPSTVEAAEPRESSYISLCVGGAITGAALAANLAGLSVLAGGADLPLIGAVATVSGGVGCALAMAMKGLFGECVAGSLQFESAALFSCTVQTVDALLDGKKERPATAVARIPAPAPAMPAVKANEAIPGPQTTDASASMPTADAY